MVTKTLCFSNPAYLSLNQKQLVIRFPDSERPRISIPIEEIGIVVLDNQQITVTHALIDALQANNSALVSCDSRHMPVGLMLPLESNTLQHERFMHQIEASQPLNKQLWQQTVRMKIHNQGSVLKWISGEEHKQMSRMEREVKSGDPDNLEGRAASYYWKRVFSGNFEFTRDHEGDGINALLNYGYAILRATIARALVGSGLLPTLGIHHHNRYNAYCLADDIMEPYRPYVDKKVFELIDGKPNEDCNINPSIKKELLQIPVIDVIIDGIRHPLMVGASITTSSLEKCFSGEKRKISYPEM